MTNHRDVLSAIGNTPLIRLNRASDDTGCEIWGKAEFLNPGQSVKDRAALYIVKDAIEKGQLRAGGTIVEGTAGNTGIGLSLVANAMGFKTVIVIPETQSQEKKDALTLYGAELIQVPAKPYKNPNNYVKLSGRLAQKLNRELPNGAIWANQFDNVANRRAHVETTGPEIWEQTQGKIDGFICAVGLGRHAGRRLDGAQGQEQGRPDRHRRPGGRGALQLLRAWRAEIGRQLDHRGHRPGPHHRQPRGRRGRPRLPDPGCRGPALSLRPARA